MLAPVLAQLDKIEGVNRSYVNYSGTLIRLTLKPTANQDEVLKSASKILNDDESLSPARVVNVEAEEWRDVDHVKELTAIEWRTVKIRAGLAIAGIVVALAALIWLIRRRRVAKRVSP